MTARGSDPVQEVVDHLAAKGVAGSIVAHTGQIDMAELEAQGWVLQETEVMHGKRIRTYSPPPGWRDKK